MSDQPDEITTIDGVAAYLETDKRTVHRLALSGKIPAFKLGGTWRFRREELDHWIVTQMDEAIELADNGSAG